MMDNKDFEYDGTKVDETKVMDRPDDVSVGGGPEGDAPKAEVQPESAAYLAILKAVTKASKRGEVAALTGDEVYDAAMPALDALYDAYEADDTVPTREAFAERCENEDVGNIVLAMKDNPFVKSSVSRGRVAAVCAGGALVVALFCGVVAVACSAGGGETPADTQEAVVATEETVEEESYSLTIGAAAEGWDAETSSPVIVHVVSEEQGVDYYHAYDANEGYQLPVPEAGTYQVSFISPVNADGSIYRTPEAQTVQAVASGDGQEATADLPYEFEPVNAEDVTADELTAIIEQVTEAIKNGDETLTGDAGTSIVETVKENCAANPNADTEAVEEEAEKATEAAQEESTAQTGGSESSTSSAGSSTGGSTASSGNGGSSSSNGGSGSGSGNSGSSNSGSTNTGSSSGNSGSSSTSTHTHNWVAQTTTVHHDAVYQTVHHDAQYKTVHHDAVTEDRTICNNCGADITGNVDAHMKANILNGCGSYSIKTVVVQAAYDEQVLVQAAYDEQVLVSAAWDETVTTGYKCSGCGATK